MTLHKVNGLECDGLSRCGRIRDPGWRLETVHRLRPERRIRLGRGTRYRWARDGRGASSPSILEAPARQKVVASYYVVDLELLVSDCQVDTFSQCVNGFNPVGSSRREPMS